MSHQRASGLLLHPTSLPGSFGIGDLNRPGQPSGNWRWRVRDEALTAAAADRLGLLAATYDRG